MLYYLYSHHSLFYVTLEWFLHVFHIISLESKRDREKQERGKGIYFSILVFLKDK